MTLKKSALIHYHELSIKGDNRPYFENKFIDNIKIYLDGLKYETILHQHARIIVKNIDHGSWNQFKARLQSMMGLANTTLVLTSTLDINQIKESAEKCIGDIKFDTFKIHTKRHNKNFEYTSPELNSIVGEHIRLITKASVKLKNPDITIYIEVVDNNAYVGWDRLKGYGGLPAGSCESALSLISSGIDSPVASFEMIKRGVKIEFIHFHSAPATTIESKQNVDEIVSYLCNFQPTSTLLHIPILTIQQEIMKIIPEKLWVIFFRRAMLSIASIIATKKNFNALVTGESIGQVASQTLANMRSIADASSLPILRPLAGSNKEEIINRAINIGTYNLSIKPYQDCCSFFIPNHPETKARIDIVKKFDSKLNIEKLLKESIDNAELKEFSFKENINENN